MIIWRKLGILGLVIPVGLAVCLQLLFGSLPFLAAIGYILGAIPVWFLGKKWNDEIDQRNQINSDQGRIMKHSLFWIHLEYWAWIAGLVGFTILLDSTLLPLGTDPLLSIWGIGILLVVAYQVYQGRNRIGTVPKEVETKTKTEEKPTSAMDAFKPSKQGGNERERILKEYKTEDHSKYMPKPSDDNANLLKTS